VNGKVKYLADGMVEDLDSERENWKVLKSCIELSQNNNYMSPDKRLSQVVRS